MAATRSLLAGGAVAVLAFAAGCGGGDGEATEPVFTGASLEAQDPGPTHVHGLGFAGDSGVLYIAAHTGLFELPPGSRAARRVGRSYQDTMGFTVVSPTLFLGSGHPDLRENLPSHLGLIKSGDQGRSWEPVSLLGEADLHVLRASGRAVYGIDARSGRLLASGDGGRTWERRALPEALVDVAVNPTDAAQLMGAGEAVLYTSANGGRTWQAVASGLSGYLAWPVSDRLYLVDSSGAVLAADGPHARWRRVGDVGGEPAAFLGVDRRTLYAALHGGAIKRSNDGGSTWEQVAP